MLRLLGNNFFVVLCLIIFYNLDSQNYSDDTIQVILKSNIPDTNKVNILNNLFLKYEFEDISTAKSCIEKALELSKKINYKKGIADCYIKSGFLAEDTGNFKSALIEYDKALKIYSELSIKKGMSTSYGNLGNVYYYTGNYPKAINSYFKALKISEEINDSKGMAKYYSNIGVIYKEQKNYKKALEYFFEGLKIDRKISNKKGIAANYGNIGIVYKELAELVRVDTLKTDSLYKISLFYLFKALKLNEELNDKFGIAINYNNIGTIYQNLKRYEEALDFFFKALKIDIETENKYGMVTDYGNIGSVYSSLNRFNESEKYLIKAINLADSINILREKMNFLFVLSELYENNKYYQKALTYYKNANSIKDSIFNQENTNKIISLEYQIKEAKVKSDFEKKSAILQMEKKRQKVIIIAVLVGLFLVSIFATFIFRSLKVTQRQNKIIEIQKKKVDKAYAELSRQNDEIIKQKIIIEQNQKEIIDSITYAKRIQDAILPPISLIKEFFPESFVLYKPKHIVSGDFYWFEFVKGNKFVAVADCTGHGVPGAMVSVLCSISLTRIVKEFNVYIPGKILDKASELIIETFSRSSIDVKDGMDISLLCISENNDISWSGGNNPLWYFQGTEIIEIKADNKPVGKSLVQKEFTTHKIEYKKDSVFYLLSDGFADQFGGPDGKKLKTKNLKNFVNSIANKNLNEQCEILNAYFEKWKKNNEQVDDVSFLGIKI